MERADKYVVIVNPKAGEGRLGKRARALLGRLEADGRIERTEYTTATGHASELAKAALEGGAQALLVAGGDGTVQQVVQGIMEHGSQKPVRLAILPLGTGNSFLRDFGAHDFDVAQASLLGDQTTPCDVVEIEHGSGTVYSINIVSFGFTSEVGALTNDRFKWLGTAGYAAAVFTSLARLHTHMTRCSFDGGVFEDIEHIFIAACNSRFTGGAMMMAPAASINDGKMSVVIAKPMSRVRLLRTFPKIYSGKHVRDDVVDIREASEIRFDDMPECDIMIDGEILRLRMRALRVVPAALRIVHPRGAS